MCTGIFYVSWEEEIVQSLGRWRSYFCLDCVTWHIPYVLAAQTSNLCAQLKSLRALCKLEDGFSFKFAVANEA